MKVKHFTILGIILVVGIFLMAGCASTPKETPSADTAASGPTWVMKGSGAFDVEGSKVFYALWT